jgi:hypothetical protein
MPERRATSADYCFFGVVVSGLVGDVGDVGDVGEVDELDEPELEPMLPVAEPDVPESELLPEALPLMPGVELEPELPGAELELELELPGEVVAPGAELELLLEEGDLLGDVLEPVLLDEELPGRDASLDFEDGERSQPVAASASATAAATSVRWVSLCMRVSFGWGGWIHRAGKTQWHQQQTLCEGSRSKRSPAGTVAASLQRCRIALRQRPPPGAPGAGPA